MHDWIEYSFNELGEILIGGTPSRSNFNYWANDDKEGYPWASIADLSKSGKYITNTKEKITEQGVLSSNVKLLPKNSIIFSFKLSVGKKAITSMPLYTNEAIASFKFNSSIVLNDFLYYALDAIDYSKHIDTAIKGVTLNKDKLQKLKINLPPLPQQEKIAKILTSCDSIISQTENAIAKYQAIKQGMMTDLFTRGIDVNTGQLRPSYQQQPELYKQSELGWIPKDWDLSKFKDVIIPIDGDRGHAYPNQSQLHSEGHCLFLSAKNVTKNGFEFSKNIFISQERDDLMGNGKLTRGDIIITTRGTVGNIALYDDSVIYEHIRINSGMLILRNKVNDKVTNRFIKTFLLSNVFDKQLERILSGSAQPQITVKNVNAFNLFIPINIAEQKAIVNRVNAIDSKLTAEKDTLKKYQQIKAGLMQDLLTGKVQVQTNNVA